MKNIRTLIIVGSILTIIYFFSGIGYFGAFDYDEAVYLAVVQEMLKTGDFFAPKYNEKNFLEKPPLFYWLTALVQKIFNFSDIAIAGRLVSILATLGTIFSIYYFTSLIFDKTTALFGSGVYTFSLCTIVISRAILTDALLNFFLSLALLTTLANLLRKHKSIWLAYFSVAFATLTKGPISAVILLAVVLVFLLIYRQNFSFKNLNPGSGILLYLLLTIPVFLKVNQATSGKFFPDFFLVHNLSRFGAKSFEGHSGPWFYYLVLIFFLLFPASAFLPAAFHDLKNKSSPEKIFLVIWATVVLIIFSFSRTKLPNYIIPATTPLSIILGIHLKELWLKNTNFFWPKTTIAIYIIISVFFAGLFLCLKPLTDILRPQFQNQNPFLMGEINPGITPVIVGITFISGIIFFVISLSKKLTRLLIISQGVFVFLLNLILINLFVPRLYQILQGDLRQISEYINSASPEAKVVAINSSLNASLVLYTRKKVFFISPDELAKVDEIKKQYHQIFFIVPKNVAGQLIPKDTKLVKTTAGYVVWLWSI